MAKQKSLDAIKAGWDGFTRPLEGQVFQHYKGGKYEIVATGFFEDTEAPCVVYRSLEKNIVWVRTARNFLENIEHDGAIQPRFAPVGMIIPRSDRPAYEWPPGLL